MQQRLVIWGDIGTDRKALLAIHLDENKNRVWIHAFPKDTLQKEVQDQLMAWKNGGEFSFPDDIPVWEVDANGEHLLPREIRVDKPEIINRTQEEWGKLIMSNRLFQLCKEEVSLFRQMVETSQEAEDDLWRRCEELSKKYVEMRNNRDLLWEQSQELKLELDSIFDMLKAKKRLSIEKEKEQSKKLVQEIGRQLDALRDALIYPDEWNRIYDELKKIRERIKESHMPWGAKRHLLGQANEVFDSLMHYRRTQAETHLKERIAKLTKVLRGIEDSLSKDRESLEMQKAKLSHYIRGNKAPAEWGGLLKITEDRIKEKEAKVTDIRKNLEELKARLEREQQAKEKKRRQEEAGDQQSDAEPNKDA